MNIRFDLAEQRHRANAEVIAFSRVCQRNPNYSGAIKNMFFTQAVDDALSQAMADDSRIVVFGENIPLLRRDLLVVDEAYEGFGLSGELAAVVLEADIPVKYARVCTQTTIAHARSMEDHILPNVERIRKAIIDLL